MKKLVSIIIRTLNEDKYLDDLLRSIKKQETQGFDVQTVIIDSGSVDKTLAIAESHDAAITHIKKNEFTFGRSLNMGSEFSSGDVLVYISGHCIPENNLWLNKLVEPIINGKIDYTYGKQIGRYTTKYSENKIFEKYFPNFSKNPQDDFFCNNANSAISRSSWKKYQFDEAITGLEDIELAKRLFKDGGKIAYISDATVYHIHDESWSQIKRRYEREAIALQAIMPEIKITIKDTARYIIAAILHDASSAIRDHKLIRELVGIISFRVAQYIGTYKGSNFKSEISRKRKEAYFYPNKKI